MTKLEFENGSWIQKVEYDTETRRMVITMRGGSKNKYECQDVPIEIYNDFKSAPSRGKYFNSNIKGQYSHEWFE